MNSFKDSMRKENKCACGITPPNTPFPEGSQTSDFTTNNFRWIHMCSDGFFSRLKKMNHIMFTLYVFNITMST